MTLAYPAFAELIVIGEEDRVPCLVIEHQGLFRSFLCDIAGAIAGGQTDLVLAEGERILSASGNAELLTDFISFDLNRKALIGKLTAELERAALSPEQYLGTRELLADIERAIGEWAFSLPVEVVPGRLSVSSLLRAVGIGLSSDYEGHAGEAEKILDYMELVRELDRDKLFVTVNMRAFFSDEIMAAFQKSALSHGHRLLMLESRAYPRLPQEKRRTVDEDLCEF